MTVRSVAAAAGCSTTGVYTWYGSKNGLVDAIFIDGFQRFGRALLLVYGAGNSDFITQADAYRDWALANPTHYMVMFGKAVPDYAPSERAWVAAGQTFDDLVAATSDTMLAVGLDNEPATVAYHLWAGIHGYVSLELAGMDMTDDEDARRERFHEGIGRIGRAWLSPPSS